MLVLKGLVGLHRTVQLQLLQCYWFGHRLGLLWYLFLLAYHECLYLVNEWISEQASPPTSMSDCGQTVFSCLLPKKHRQVHSFITVYRNNKPKKNCTFLLSDFLTKYKFINSCNIWMFPELYFSTMIHIIEENGLKRNKQLFFNILQMTYSIPCNTAKQSPKQERRSSLMKDSLDFNKIEFLLIQFLLRCLSQHHLPSPQPCLISDETSHF